MIGHLSILARPDITGALEVSEGIVTVFVVSILACPDRTGALPLMQNTSRYTQFQSSPAQIGLVLVNGYIVAIQQKCVSILASPDRTGALNQGKDNTQLQSVSILVRPDRSGALKATSVYYPFIAVSILARPNRTGALPPQKKASFQHVGPPIVQTIINGCLSRA